jgi:hypothetical protein
MLFGKRDVQENTVDAFKSLKDEPCQERDEKGRYGGAFC